MEFDILAYNNNNNNVESNTTNNNTYRPTKIAKLENDFSSSKIAFSNVGCYNDDDHMLSFNNSSNNNGSWINGSHCKTSFYSNGFSCSGGNMSASMYAMSGAKGPFTTSQWLELEQQAMIYKYIIANEPIPPNLLISITRAFESACFSSYNGGFLRPSSFGWGPFHLGFSNNTDPEPGRCRRTDGKKWRCSRDAVPDQKYCERHMNRGRHRSRKPVEGQVGHSTSRTNTSKTNTNTNLVNMTSPSSALVVPGGGSANSFAITLNQNKDSHPVTRLDFLSPSISLNSSGNAFSINKEQNQYAESAGAGGFAGLKNPYGLSSYDLNALESNPHSSDHSSIVWLTQPDKTQLSISIPAPLPADFMSSTSSPTGERITPISPLRLSRALDTFEMGLNVGATEQSAKQSSWVPISWETSMGGPLGEVLKTSSNSSEDHRRKDISSPNHVLQRTALCSLSTSSGGSSPQAEDGKPLENVGCNVRLV